MAQLGLYRKDAGPTPAARSKFAVELRHVAKSYNNKNGGEVYSDLHFQLNHGTFVAAVGPIGCGKTTLVNMFAGLEKPTSGTIMVEGQDITQLDEDSIAAFRVKNIGLLPQVQTLVPGLTAYQNVELPLRFAGVDAATRQRRVDSIMDRVGIGGEFDREVSTLSVGERQMVSFARALVNDPPILILDEPTEALDPLMSDVILGLLRGDNITAGKTIFVTTHDKRVTDLAKKTLRLRKKIP
jgi:ABC-type lipoprotein export system ATPase subunit